MKAFFIATALLLPVSLAHSASVVLVTQNEGSDADLIATLEGLGHTVTSYGNNAHADGQALAPVNPAGAAVLNAADLVVVSRDTNSGNYDANTASWDAITAPLILGNAYLARSSRWQWVNTGGIQTSYSGDLQPQSAGHLDSWLYQGLTPSTPGFNGLLKYDLWGSGSVDIPQGSNNILGTGQILGVRNNVNNQRVIAAQWNAGGVTGSGNVLAANRYFFALPIDHTGGFNANGDIAFANLVTFAVPEPSRALLLGAGLGLLLVRRRR